MQFLEVKALRILGKKSCDTEVKDFISELHEIPEVDNSDIGLEEDIKDYYFRKNGLMLMFDKKKETLINLKVYFQAVRGFKKFKGFFNLIMNENANKKSIIKILGCPTEENNKAKSSYGIIIPKWIVYYYEHYTLRCAFYGDDDKLAEVNLMTIEGTPGREIMS